MAHRVVDQLEAIQVDEHDRQFGVVSLRLNDGQTQPVLEQYPVGQIGQDVVIGLIRDQFLRPLALRDIARNTVGSEKLAWLSSSGSARTFPWN